MMRRPALHSFCFLLVSISISPCGGLVFPDITDSHFGATIRNLQNTVASTSLHSQQVQPEAMPNNAPSMGPIIVAVSWVESTAGQLFKGWPAFTQQAAASGQSVPAPAEAIHNFLQSKQDWFKNPFNIRPEELNHAQKTAILMVAGGIAGATAKTCIAPLERVKLLAQAGECKDGLVSAFRTVIQKEGLVGLWRGNSVNVLRMVPNKGVLHATNDLYKSLARDIAIAVPAVAAAGAGAQYFISGSLAGMSSVAATYPLDLIRTRMAGRLVDGERMKSGVVSKTWLGTAKSVVKNEGVLGLYRGVSPTLIGSIPYEGIKFYCYAVFKELLPKNEDGSQHLGWKLFSGAAAATVAHVVTYPMDTVRRRMQLQGAGGAANIYKNAADCAGQMWKKEGPKSLYRGLTATCIRGVPNTGIQFAVYEALKTVLLLA